jgi:Zn-dependent oligopeptidase
MDLADIKPALKTAMANHLAELDIIAENPEPPTFENTILAMEAAGKDYDRERPLCMEAPVSRSTRVCGSERPWAPFTDHAVSLATKP